MQDNHSETDWTWTPAPMRPRAGLQIVGALVIMAASCTAAGFLVGRITARPPGNIALRQTVPPAPNVALKSEGDRTASAVPPDGEAGRKSAMSPVIILNPGTADKVREQKDKPEVATARVRDASNETRAKSNEDRDRELRDYDKQSQMRRESTSSGSERDYHALRDYMLSR
jgi:hypothetical protein